MALPAGWRAALESSEGLDPTPTNLNKVAQSVGEEAARWAFSMWDARARAATKFARASEMLLTREALEQATHERVAAFHARRFPAGALVADLTVGIGADLLALAARGPTIGFDLDAERAAYALHNLKMHGLEAEVRVADCLEEWPDVRYAFADPARRVAGRRTLQIDEFAPDPREVARRMEPLSLGGIKLTPMLPDHQLEALGPELEFVSFGSECREAIVWLGREANAGRRAVHIESGESIDTGPAAVEVDHPQAFFYEADPAAIRSHALGTLGRAHDLKALGESNGYLTGDGLVRSVWLKAYRVLHHGRADMKTTRKALAHLNAARPVLKQRGTKLDLQSLLKEFKPQGTREVALAIWPVGKSLRHTILEIAR
jgi:hypothetical protein